MARAFQQLLRQTLTPEGRRAWSDKTIQRILAHLKTFATWVHTHQPFPLGHPMAAIKLPTLGTGLEVDRALPRPNAAACSMRPISSSRLAGARKIASAIRRGSAPAAWATARIATAPSCIR